MWVEGGETAASQLTHDEDLTPRTFVTTRNRRHYLDAIFNVFHYREVRLNADRREDECCFVFTNLKPSACLPPVVIVDRGSLLGAGKREKEGFTNVASLGKPRFFSTIMTSVAIAGSFSRVTVFITKRFLSFRTQLLAKTQLTGGFSCGPSEARRRPCGGTNRSTRRERKKKKREKKRIPHLGSRMFDHVTLASTSCCSPFPATRPAIPTRMKFYCATCNRWDPVRIGALIFSPRKSVLFFFFFF